MNTCSTKGNGKSVLDKSCKEMADLTIDVITTLDQIMHAFVIDGDDLDTIGLNVHAATMDLAAL
jgi:hypothetical protein